MTRAAGMTVAGVQPDRVQELDELRFHWGAAYDVSYARGTYTARRRDGLGGEIADPAPDGLRKRMRADYEASPVPKDLP